jgi:hypothetical protein
MRRDGPRCGWSSAVGVVLAVENVLGVGHNKVESAMCSPLERFRRL